MNLHRFALLGLLASSMSATPIAAASSIVISSPANGATVSSPFTLTARATGCAGGAILFMNYSVDGGGTTAEAAFFSVSISASAGTHVLTVTCYGWSGQEQASVTVKVGSSSSKTAATPQFSPPSGTYSGKQNVTLFDATAGATIYYTTDGSGPTTSSTRYTGPIPVSRSMVIQALAAAPGYSNSGLARASYTIQVSSPGGGPYIPPNAITVTGIQSRPGWSTRFDEGSNGSGYGQTSVVATPSLSGQARRFDTTFTYYGGVRYSIDYDHDAAARNFVLDARVRIRSGSTVANLEMDNNQVIANGNTVLYAFQCSGIAGQWEFAENAGTPAFSSAKWVRSGAPCKPAGWTPDTWHHVQISYSRDDYGNVTFHSVWLDGVEAPINATVPAAFSLGWGAGSLVTNVQVGGDSGSGSSTVFVDNLKISRW